MSLPTRRRALLATLIALTAALAACSPSPRAEAPPTTARGNDALARVLEAGTLTVATEGTYRPFSQHADGSGELTGYGVEVARAVGERLGVDIRFSETRWDAIFAGLMAGRFDMIANQVSITPERTRSYLFSTPVRWKDRQGRPAASRRPP